jgi:hypothetical protein
MTGNSANRDYFGAWRIISNCNGSMECGKFEVNYCFEAGIAISRRYLYSPGGETGGFSFNFPFPVIAAMI